MFILLHGQKSGSIVPRAASRLIACALLASSLAHPLPAQGLDPNDPGITLTVSPSDIPTNGTVRIAGLAYPQPGAQVRVTISLPSGAPTVFIVTPDKTGHYSLLFGQTAAQGTYTVSVQAGEKNAPAKATFTAKTYLIDIDEDVADNKALLEQDTAAAKAVDKALDNIPDSPAKTDLKTRLAKLEPVLSQLPAQSQQLANALKPLQQIVQQYPDAAPMLQPVFDHVAQLSDEAKESREQYGQEIVASESGTQTCDQIDHATQALKIVPQAMALAAEPLVFVKEFVTRMAATTVSDAGGPAGAAGTLAEKFGETQKAEENAGEAAEKWSGALRESRSAATEMAIDAATETKFADNLMEGMPEDIRSSPTFKLVIGEVKKAAPKIAGGLTDASKLFDLGTTLAGDAIAYANEQVFAKYCEKFEGTFTATMVAHFYKRSETGKLFEWWGYTTAIKGKIVLRYPKGATGAATLLSGQLEGGATGFTYHQDALNPAAFGAGIKGARVGYIDVPPLATDDASGGAMNALTSPTSFYVPVTGEFANGKVTLNVSDARTDFNKDYTRAHTVYVVIGPQTLMLPIWGHFSLPYVGAQFILNQVVPGDYTVVQGKTSMSIQKTWTRERPANMNLAVYTLDLKACNPGCP